ncbi:alpha amylase C-terminal domain-containing protein [Microcoleus sp. FACHB-831]|uniref:alpha-amylase family glycosyl hydrolase n=1 Tax=Microcoleus sp. FACHB-831 TaxID=2692827 RepID=UPI001687E506|nr:alpha-amylase family glycosyl hydrolase [Microcoleus sp. FACHB-831]MBD1924366.1 alpha amylase C-terminal domain-containing protein [Microcoleus sp. FACHB-831]
MPSLIEFNLFAPNNKEARLIGSFNQGKEISMKKGENGYFRTKVELEDGVYQYKFRIQSKTPSLNPEQWLEVIDPYATDVDETTKNAIVQIKNGKRIVDDYVWQNDDKPLPENHELVIYEMHVADFSGDEPRDRNKFKHVIEKLDYLSELGINAIELMPVNEYPGNYSWGYLIRHFFATETSYGTTAELKRLIDECHGRGIRVILDGIYNHCEDKCPLLQIDRDYWYYHDKHYPDDPANYWGPEFNYDNYDEKLDIKPAWKYIGDVVRYWIEEYHIDGIRFDAVRQLANNDFFYWVVEEAKKAAGNKPFYNIAEHIPDTSSIVTPEGPLDACWHESFRIFAIENITGDTFNIDRLKEALDGKQQGYSGATSVINYLASHDRDHLMAEEHLRTLDKEQAIKRAKLGAVLLMTAMGVPMIWMGEEFGEYTRQTPNQQNKLNWSILKHEANRSLLEDYKTLIALRKQTPALQTENIEFFHENSEAKVLGYVRWNDEGSRVVVVANFSDKSLMDYKIPNFPAAGTWHECTSSYDVESREDGVTIMLPEYEAAVFVWVGGNE